MYVVMVVDDFELIEIFEQYEKGAAVEFDPLMDHAVLADARSSHLVQARPPHSPTSCCAFYPPTLSKQPRYRDE